MPFRGGSVPTPPSTPREHGGLAAYPASRVARRLGAIIENQGLGLPLGIFGVFFFFIFVPVFVVDDLLYLHTVAPEVDSRSHRVRGGVQDLEARHRRDPGVSLRPLKQHNHTRGSLLAVHEERLRNATGRDVGPYALSGFPDSRGAPKSEPARVRDSDRVRDDDTNAVAADDEPAPTVDDGGRAERAPRERAAPPAADDDDDAPPPPRPAPGAATAAAEDASDEPQMTLEEDAPKAAPAEDGADRAKQPSDAEEPQMTLEEDAPEAAPAEKDKVLAEIASDPSQDTEE